MYLSIYIGFTSDCNARVHKTCILGSALTDPCIEAIPKSSYALVLYIYVNLAPLLNLGWMGWLYFYQAHRPQANIYINIW